MKKTLFGFTVSIMATALSNFSFPASAETPFPDGTRIFGYKETGSTAGVYELSPTGSNLFWEDAHFKKSMFSPLRAAWFAEDGNTLCGYAVDYSFGSLLGNYYVEYDWNTGAVLKSKSLPDYKDPFILYGALNPDQNYIYGYGYTKNGETALLKAPTDNPGNFQTVKLVDSDEFCYGVTWNSTDRILTGMRGNGTLVEINADGNQRVILDTGIKTAHSSEFTAPSGLAWSETEKLYYWNPLCQRGSGGDSSLVGCLYSIDASAGVTTEIPEFESDGSNFKFIIAKCERIASEAPAAPEISQISFFGDSLSGTATMILPTLSETGNPLAGSLTYVVILDGGKWSEGTGNPGETVTINLDDLAQGRHTLAVTVSSDDKTGEEVLRNFYVGNDTPESPANVELSYNLVSWDASVKGVHDGYVNTAEMQYEVYLNGEIAGTTSGTSLTVEIPHTGPLYHVSATVYAICAGMTSEPGLSNTLLAGSAMEVPFNMVPTAEEAALCTYTDGNGDGKGWNYNEAEKAFYSGYSAEVDMDDWIFLPAFELKANTIYDFSIYSKRRATTYEEEYLEVRYGRSPEPKAMTGNIISDFKPEPDYTRTAGTLQTDEEGKWYIGIHATSLPGQFGIYVKDISLSNNGVTTNSPKGVSFLRATPADEGGLSATISFTMPEKRINGNQIASSRTIRAIITADNEVEVSGKPGEQMSAQLRTVQGYNNVSVTTWIGDIRGETETIEVFTGVHIPAMPEEVKATVSEDMKSALITWEAPNIGYGGGFIKQDDLTYDVYVQVSTGMGAKWEAVATGLTVKEFTFVAPSEKQDYYDLAVKAANIAGVSPDYATTFAVLGTPYPLPMEDDFEKAHYEYEPWVTYMPDTSYATQWGMLPIESIPVVNDDTGIAVAGMGLVDGCKGMAGLPVFSTLNQRKVSINMKIYTGPESADDMFISAQCYGMDEPEEIERVKKDGEWEYLHCLIPDKFLDKAWVKLFINATFPLGSENWFVLDQYMITPEMGIGMNTQNGIDVKGGRSSIDIQSQEEAAVSIYTTDGRKVHDLVITEGFHSIEMLPGLYIVSVNNTSTKVLVK